MDWTQAIGNLATIATTINFASGIQICHRIFKLGTTANCTAAPFMMGMLCSFIWFQYGIHKPDVTVAFVNVIGFTLQTSFLFWFYLYTKPKNKINIQIGVLLVVILSLHWYFYFGSNDIEFSSKVAGYLGAFASIAFFASPLMLLARVLQTRCSECLPLPLIVSSFCTVLLWTTYGYLQNDPFIIVPNGLATMITSSQLALILIFPSKQQSDLTHLV